ncbi:TMEM175 family protein [soil metagenome]
MNKSRLEAFSDGVLAIIITIMILEIKIPHGSDWSELNPLIPAILSYLMSFIYIGIYWGNHHHILYSLKRITSGIIWANLNLLFWLSLIPFATGWMGENHFAPNTVAVYGLLLLLCGVAFTILQKLVENQIHGVEDLEKAFSGLKIKGIVSTLAYIVSIPLAFINSTLSCGIFVAVAILWIIPSKEIEKAVNKK